jgi:protein-tyrosine phosphatase
VALEDLWGSWPPQDPASELRNIEHATEAVVAELGAGRGVVVHCLGGIGRTGTVLAASLVRLGLDITSSISHIKAINMARGYDWPEADWQLEAIDRTSR